MSTATARVTRKAKGVGDSRYSLTPQFLTSSAIFARRCSNIENHPADPDDPGRIEHKGLVTAAIMQSVAAVEAECAEFLTHRLGHIDKEERKFLKPCVKLIDSQRGVVDRYTLITHLLHKPLAEDKPVQHMRVVAMLRNELVHYRSRWGEAMERAEKEAEEKARVHLFKELRGLKLPKPPFISKDAPFPLPVLHAACAAWAVQTAVAFINAFYQRLGIASPLPGYMPQFDGLQRIVRGDLT